MGLFLNGTEMFVRVGANGLTSPEMILARYAQRARLALKCDGSIRYTIIR